MQWLAMKRGERPSPQASLALLREMLLTKTLRAMHIAACRN
jgi:hypothetical protein